MGFEANTGLGVNNHYGQRDTGHGIGHIKTEGSVNELVVDVTGDMLNDTFRLPVVLPVESIFLDAYVDVEEAFVLGGTTPTILVGTSGSEVTNGVVVSETLAEAVGSAAITGTFTGTWSVTAGLAAATTVGVVLGGTTPTATAGVGKARVVIRYANIAP